MGVLPSAIDVKQSAFCYFLFIQYCFYWVPINRRAESYRSTFAALLTWCFLSETLLRLILLKDCRRDFFMLFTLDRGPSMASWSLGLSVHLQLGKYRVNTYSNEYWHCWYTKSLQIILIFQRNPITLRDDQRINISIYIANNWLISEWIHLFVQFTTFF